MGYRTHLNARADQCTTPTFERGHRIVRYQREEYVLVGFYFARGLNEQRELFYILRLNGADSDGLPDRG